jgi:hypothetical protein
MSFSNHAHESSKVIILVMWLKESGTVEGNVPEVENYTCDVVEGIRNSRRECAKGRELYMGVKSSYLCCG